MAFLLFLLTAKKLYSCIDTCSETVDGSEIGRSPPGKNYQPQLVQAVVFYPSTVSLCITTDITFEGLGHFIDLFRVVLVR